MRENPIASIIFRGPADPTVVAELWEVVADAVAAVLEPATVDTTGVDTVGPTVGPAVGMAVADMSPLTVRGAPTLWHNAEANTSVSV